MRLLESADSSEVACYFPCALLATRKPSRHKRYVLSNEARGRQQIERHATCLDLLVDPAAQSEGRGSGLRYVLNQRIQSLLC